LNPTETAALADWPVLPPALPHDPVLEARIAQILARMTLAHKVGQMTQPDIRWITPDDVRAHAIGSVLNGGGAWPQGNKQASLADWLALARAYDAAALAADPANPVPLVWGTDAVHGHNNVRGATVFPHNIGLGAAGDADLVEAIGAATARAVRASGIGWAFAPTLAVVRDERWGRTYESFSEDPALVACLGAATVRGLQGQLGADDSVLACAKHFVGDGGTEGGQDQGINRATRSALIQGHAAGYFSALAAGVQTVMVSFNSWHETLPDGRPGPVHGKLHGSHHLITQVLKQRLGFDGLVVSDWNGVGQVPGCTNSRCASALNAGIDMVMVPEQWREFIAETIALVQAGEVPTARIDDAVTRILRVKLRAGLFNQPSSQGRWAGSEQAIQARDLARRAVRQSLVLLKNQSRNPSPFQSQVLPLPRHSRLLVVGKSADSLENQTGGWTLTWQGTGNANADFPAGDSVLAGLRQALGEAQVAYSATAEGVDVDAFDAVVAVLGETPYAEGAGDRAQPGGLHHASRHPEDLAVLRRVHGHGVPVVTVLLTGRPLYVNDLINRSDAFVVGWLPGSEGAGVADVLLRAADGHPAHDFRGRLPFSWPGQACPAPRGAPEAPAPLFARGFGLRYGDPTGALGMLDEQAPPADPQRSSERLLFDRVAQPGCRLMVGAWPDAWAGATAVAGATGANSAPDAAGATGPSSPAWPDQDLGDDLNAVVSAPAQAAIAIQASTVQMHTQQDARRVRWYGPARLFITCNPALRLETMADAALVMDVRLLAPPEAAVTVAMVSEGGHSTALDLTPKLSGLALHQVHTLKLPLARFAQGGVDLSRTLVPLCLASQGALTLDLARVRIVAGAAAHADADAVPAQALPTATAPRIL